MKAIVSYINFNGNCKEAMEYYQEIFGGKLELMTAKQGNHQDYFDSEDAILHANLQIKPEITIMASDCPKNAKTLFGNSVNISIACESLEEIEKFYNFFEKSAKKIIMPLADTFWGAKFAMLTDKFEINWMFNFDYIQQKK